MGWYCGDRTSSRLFKSLKREKGKFYSFIERQNRMPHVRDWGLEFFHSKPSLKEFKKRDILTKRLVITGLLTRSYQCPMWAVRYGDKEWLHNHSNRFQVHISSYECRFQRSMYDGLWCHPKWRGVGYSLEIVGDRRLRIIHCKGSAPQWQIGRSHWKQFSWHLTQSMQQLSNLLRSGIRLKSQARKQYYLKGWSGLMSSASSVKSFLEFPW